MDLDLEILNHFSLHCLTIYLYKSPIFRCPYFPTIDLFIMEFVNAQWQHIRRNKYLQAEKLELKPHWICLKKTHHQHQHPTNPITIPLLHLLDFAKPNCSSSPLQGLQSHLMVQFFSKVAKLLVHYLITY